MRKILEVKANIFFLRIDTGIHGHGLRRLDWMTDVLAWAPPSLSLICAQNIGAQLSDYSGGPYMALSLARSWAWGGFFSNLLGGSLRDLLWNMFSCKQNERPRKLKLWTDVFNTIPNVDTQIWNSKLLVLVLFFLAHIALKVCCLKITGSALV